METRYIKNPFQGTTSQIGGESVDLGGSASGISRSRLDNYCGSLVERSVHIPNKTDETWCLEIFYTTDRLKSVTFRNGIRLPEYNFSMLIIELRENEDTINDYESFSMGVTLQALHPNGRILRYSRKLEIEGSDPAIFNSGEELNGFPITRLGSVFQIGSEFNSPYIPDGNFGMYDETLLMISEDKVFLSPFVEGKNSLFGTTVSVDYLNLTKCITKMFRNISLNIRGPKATENLKRFGHVDFNNYFSRTLRIAPSAIHLD